MQVSRSLDVSLSSKYHPILRHYTSARQPVPWLVSKWMVNGTVQSYLTERPSTNRLGIISDVVEGLTYLHEMGLVHGDLKCINILVDEQEHACLADLGLAALHYDGKADFIKGTTVVGFSRRWTAPEIFDPQRFNLSRSRFTKESDVYAFSMVMWEIFTGTSPFVDLNGFSEHRLTLAIVCGHRMERPVQATSLGLCDETWAIMEHCWKPEPSVRPSITSVRKDLTRLRDNVHPDSLVAPQKWPLEIAIASGPKIDGVSSQT